MAGFYDIAKQYFLTSASYIDLAANTIKVRPTRTGTYTYAATHTAMTSVTAATGGPGDVTLGTKVIKTGADGGDFDAADAVFTAWTAGTAIDGLVIFKFVTADADSIPIAYLDGFSVTPNGGDITFQWAGSSPWIFSI